MKNLIKTGTLLDDSGKEFNLGKHINRTLFMIPLAKEEAIRLFDEGKRVYFIYQDWHTVEIYDGPCRKVCRDRDYLIHHYDLYNEVCGIPMPLNVLTEEEGNALDRLADQSGMDSWFWIIARNNKTVILNYEKNEVESLKSALPKFIKGLADLDNYRISKKQKAAFLQLVERFQLTDAYNARLA